MKYNEYIKLIINKIESGEILTPMEDWDINNIRGGQN